MRAVSTLRNSYHPGLVGEFFHAVFVTARPRLKFQGGGLVFFVPRPPSETSYLLLAIAVVISITSALETDGILRIRHRLRFGLRSSRLGGLVDLRGVRATDWIHHPILIGCSGDEH